MKYIKLFENRDNPIKKYWKIKAPANRSDYTAAALDKIGMPKNNYWYPFVFKFLDKVIIVSHDETSVWDGWGVKYSFEEEKLKEEGYEYQGEVVPTDYEIDAIKYNL